MDRRSSGLEGALVRRATRRAAELVSRFYVLAPREWERMPFEVRTESQLSPPELCEDAYAQVLCYSVERRVGDRIVHESELYRICLQDRTILGRSESTGIDRLSAVLLYVLTHELVHVVRFGQRMQCIDLPAPLRSTEELSVDRTARRILHGVTEPGLQDALDHFKPSLVGL